MTRREEILEFIDRKGFIAILLTINAYCKQHAADCILFGGVGDKWKPFWDTGVEMTDKMLEQYKSIGMPR